MSWAGSTSAPYALTLGYPGVTITSISPAFGALGDTMNVVVTGSGFIAGATTLSLGAGITVTNVVVTSGTELSATLGIDATTAIGFRDVTVTNPSTGSPPTGGGSATLGNGFEIRNPVPTISNLAPSAVEEGSGAVTVTINGSLFVADSVAYFAGSARATTFVNSGQLLMELTAGDTSVISDYNVHVNNPAPGGGNSNTAIFSVVDSGGSFNAVEAGQGVGGRLFTKLSGVAFGFDVFATDVGRTAINTGFTGEVVVELLDATDDSAPLDANGCRASWSAAASRPASWTMCTGRPEWRTRSADAACPLASSPLATISETTSPAPCA
jgi:hypothetical protein